MPALKELMGDLERGDGRKCIKTPFMHHKEFYFEPIFLDADKIYWHGLDDKGNYCRYEAEYGNDWQEWHPPKKKVKLYKYAYTTLSGIWMDSNCYMKNDEIDLWIQNNKIHNIKRLDYTMIEVDDES